MKTKISLITVFMLGLSGCAHQQNTAKNSDEITPMPDSLLVPQMQQLPPQDRIVSKDIYQEQTTSNTEVVRDGRYTLISIAPEEGQKYLLEQVVSVKVPNTKNRFTANVQQGLRTTLTNTGLDLCSPSIGEQGNAVQTLFTRPLPKVHYQFGPIKLYEALQMIAGPAYELTLNDISRTICFKARESSFQNPHKPTMAVTTTTVTTEVIEE
ncbi:hypothetical protein [Mannheimia haemolytica]|uniref:PFGI-1 class ICE element type IV pilus protein PilL2 n=1 Tax=Mannheimia haemolytica TaxID=75985 RepID=UPI0025A20006|nr:hypothetical protein [Mannheimia haemolytica]